MAFARVSSKSSTTLHTAGKYYFVCQDSVGVFRTCPTEQLALDLALNYVASTANQRTPQQRCLTRRMSVPILAGFFGLGRN